MRHDEPIGLAHHCFDFHQFKAYLDLVSSTQIARILSATSRLLGLVVVLPLSRSAGRVALTDTQSMFGREKESEENTFGTRA